MFSEMTKPTLLTDTPRLKSSRPTCCSAEPRLVSHVQYTFGGKVFYFDCTDVICGHTHQSVCCLLTGWQCQMPEKSKHFTAKTVLALSYSYLSYSLLVSVLESSSPKVTICHSVYRLQYWSWSHVLWLLNDPLALTFCFSYSRNKLQYTL